MRVSVGGINIGVIFAVKQDHLTLTAILFERQKEILRSVVKRKEAPNHVSNHHQSINLSLFSHDAL